MPTYSKINDDADEISRLIVQVMGVMALVCFPIGAGIAVVAADLVHTVFGSKWDAAIPLFRWLAMFGVFAGLGRPLMPLFYSLKHEKFYSFLCSAQVLATIPIVYFAAHTASLEAVAASRSIVAALFFFIFCVATTRIVNVQLHQFMRVLWRPAIASVGMAAIVWALQDDGPHIPLLYLVRDSVIGAFAFIAIELGLWRAMRCPAGPEEEIIKRARGIILRVINRL